MYKRQSTYIRVFGNGQFATLQSEEDADNSLYCGNDVAAIHKTRHGIVIDTMSNIHPATKKLLRHNVERIFKDSAQFNINNK
jgi:hypothetical protein